MATLPTPMLDRRNEVIGLVGLNGVGKLIEVTRMERVVDVCPLLLFSQALRYCRFAAARLADQPGNPMALFFHAKASERGCCLR